MKEFNDLTFDSVLERLKEKVGNQIKKAVVKVSFELDGSGHKKPHFSFGDLIELDAEEPLVKKGWDSVEKEGYYYVPYALFDEFDYEPYFCLPDFIDEFFKGAYSGYNNESWETYLDGYKEFFKRSIKEDGVTIHPLDITSINLEETRYETRQLETATLRHHFLYEQVSELLENHIADKALRESIGEKMHRLSQASFDTGREFELTNIRENGFLETYIKGEPMAKPQGKGRGKAKFSEGELAYYKRRVSKVDYQIMDDLIAEGIAKIDPQDSNKYFFKKRKDSTSLDSLSKKFNRHPEVLNKLLDT